MSAPYQLMYRVGMTPWDNHETPQPLVDLIENRPVARMLDVGCGTGNDAIWCASRGWDVTGVDAVSVPIRKARRRALDAGVAVRFLQADIATVDAAQLGTNYTVLQDIGCFAGLSDIDRRAAAATMTAIAAAGARLLMFAFGPGGGGRFGPRRMEPFEVPALFPDWKVEFSRSADEMDVKGPLRNAPRYWHQLVKD
jgi:SAM-dependent methyltransferase